MGIIGGIVLGSLFNKRVTLGALCAAIAINALAGTAHAHAPPSGEPAFGQGERTIVLDINEPAVDNSTPVAAITEESSYDDIKQHIANLRDPDWLAQQDVSLSDLNNIARGEWTPEKAMQLEILMNKLIQEDPRSADTMFFIAPESEDIYEMKKWALLEHEQTLSEEHRLGRGLPSDIRDEYISKAKMGTALTLGAVDAETHLSIASGIPIDFHADGKRSFSLLDNQQIGVDDAFMITITAVHELAHSLVAHQKIYHDAANEYEQTLLVHMDERSADALAATILGAYLHDDGYFEGQLEAYMQYRTLDRLLGLNHVTSGVPWPIEHLTSDALDTVLQNKDLLKQELHWFNSDGTTFFDMSQYMAKTLEDTMGENSSDREQTMDSIYRGFVDAHNFIFNGDKVSRDNVEGNTHFHFLVQTYIDSIHYKKNIDPKGVADVKLRYEAQFTDSERNAGIDQMREKSAQILQLNAMANAM